MEQRVAIQAMAAAQAVQTMQALQAAAQLQPPPQAPPQAPVRPRKPATPPRATPEAANGERKRSLKFLPHHALKFALSPVTRNAESGDVAVALCLFCRHFGREERAGRKRKATANLKFFKRSFRTDQYVQHHASQHAALWARYDALTDEDKRAFFPAEGGRAPPPAQAKQQLRARQPNEIAASAPTRQERRCWFELLAPVLDLVLRLSADEARVYVFSTTYDARRSRSPAETWTPAPGAFWSVELVAPGAEDDGATASAFGAASASLADAAARSSSPVNRVVVYSCEEMDAMVELAAGGLSCQQMVHALRWLGKHAPVLQAPPEDLNTQEQTVEFVRLATAASLQMTSRLLHEAWSVGVDLCAHSCVPERPFVNVRVRFYCMGRVRSAHRHLRSDIIRTSERMKSASPSSAADAEIDPLDAYMASLEVPDDAAQQLDAPIDGAGRGSGAGDHEWRRARVSTAIDVVAKNRRYKRLQQLLQVDGDAQGEGVAGEDAYFSDTMMQQRNPALFHFYVGQYLVGRNSQESGDTTPVTAEAGFLSSFLMRTQERSEMETRRRAEQQRWGRYEARDDAAARECDSRLLEEEEEEEEGEERSSDIDDEDEEEAKENTDDGRAPHSIEERRRQLVEVMSARFLQGDDSEYVNYAEVDADEALDDLEAMDRDAQDRYFATDE